MKLKILLPNKVLIDETVTKIVAEAENGSFCLKPRHIDFVTALVPGLMSYISAHGGEKYLAVDEGTLVKCGPEVLVSTRDAVPGIDLDSLRTTVEDRYLAISDADRIARGSLARLEAGIVRRYFELRDTPS